MPKYPGRGPGILFLENDGGRTTGIAIRRTSRVWGRQGTDRDWGWLVGGMELACHPLLFVATHRHAVFVGLVVGPVSRSSLTAGGAK